MDPERSHDLVLATMAAISNSSIAANAVQQFYGNRVPSLPTQVMGLDFPNPVGLAAGLDKQGNCVRAFSALGFGSVELGTVTPEPQKGNDKPRMFRLQSHHAVINRMGFNSIGLDAFLRNLGAASSEVIRGINIGKNAATPMEKATDDYLLCLEAVYTHADYITINISSPNTSNLRNLQQDDALDNLLNVLKRRAIELAEKRGRYVPLVLKVAPDLTHEQIKTIAGLLRKHGIDAIAATNTTISRDNISGHPHASEGGGLSGRPVRGQSTDVVLMLFQELQGEVPIIGIGGIDSPEAAVEKLAAGADLIQIYTGLIYQGPALIREIVTKLKMQAGNHDFPSWLQSLRLSH